VGLAAPIRPSPHYRELPPVGRRKRRAKE
jgi:hypothetical protein